MARDFYPTGQVTFEGGVLVQADKFSAKAEGSCTSSARWRDCEGAANLGQAL